MHATTQALMENILRPQETDRLIAHCSSIADHLGFDYFAYGLRSPLPISSPRMEMLGNYPDAWQERYKRRKYADIDPAVRHCVNTPVPLLWSCETFQVKDFAEEAIAHGIRHGVSVCVRDAQGYLGMLTLARDARPCSAQEFSQLKSAFALMGQTAHAALSERLRQDTVAAPIQELSSREREVLMWTAEGKTAEEVALIMDITKRTVNFHITNCVTKLDASNKLHAAVKAAMLGLLS